MMRSTSFLASALCAAFLAGCSDPVARAEETGIPSVEAVQARSGALPLRERVSGTVRAANQVAIRAEVEGAVLEVYVRSGEAVREGQPLVRLDDRELREQLRQAEANERVARASAAEESARVAELATRLERTRRLAAEQLVSRADLDALEAQVAAARASADQATAQIDQAAALVRQRASALSRTVVRAPVSGHVGRRNAEVGMIAQPDTLLFQIGDLETLVVDVPLTQRMLAHVRTGNRALVSSPALGEAPIEATLSRVSPFLDAGSFSTTGEIDVTNREGRLVPGMFVTVDLLYGESAPSTLVPTSAVWEDPRTGTLGVWTVDSAAPPAPEGEISEEPNPVSLRPVTLLAEGGGVAGVSGIAAGQWVVTVGQNLLGEREAKQARIRPVAWERVVRLQALQRENLAEEFLRKQQRIARTQGVEPPSAGEYLGGSPGGSK